MCHFSIARCFHSNGEGKEEAASPQKRKPTPPRCARQPLPREGARVDTPSFLWKEVPRRGGGWMGKAVSPTHSLPRVGKVASGASRIGQWRYERQVGKIVSSAPFTRAPYPPLARSPFPDGEGFDTRASLSRIVRANTRICGGKNNDGQSLPRVGEVASGASRIGF